MPKPNKGRIHLYSPNFVGVVIRNIPEDYDCKDILEYLQKIKINAELLQCIEIKSEIFGLLKLNSIEDAENTCLFLNERILGQKALKAHIHSKSNFARRGGELKAFKSYFENENIDPSKYVGVINNLRETLAPDQKNQKCKSESHSSRSSNDDHHRSSIIREEKAIA